MRMALSHIDELSSSSSDRCVARTLHRKRNERGMNHFFVCATIRFSQSSEVGGKLEREKDTFIWN